MPNHVRLLKSRVPGRRLIWGAREKELGNREKIKNDDSQQRFLAQHSVAMLEQCCNHSKQCCNAVLLYKSSSRIISCNITFKAITTVWKYSLRQTQLLTGTFSSARCSKSLLNEPTMGLVSLLRAQESGSKFYGQSQSTVIWFRFTSVTYRWKQST